MFIVGDKEAYLVLTIPFVVAWLLLYFLSKKTRREQLMMSLLILPTGTIGELIYFKDYWLPQSVLSINILGVPILLEDLVFSFCIGGIGSVIYEALLRKHLKRIKRYKSGYYINSKTIIIICGVISYLLYKFGLNSIFATSVGFVLAAIFILAQRHDLFFDSIFSGLAVMLIMFLSYFILFNTVGNDEELLNRIWLIYSSPLDLRIFGIPLTEMVWGFSWGMLAGPLYEFRKKMAIR